MIDKRRYYFPTQARIVSHYACCYAHTQARIFHVTVVAMSSPVPAMTNTTPVRFFFQLRQTQKNKVKSGK